MKKLASAFLLLLLFCLFSCAKEETCPLTVVFFDVGQGDATLIRTEAGDILIDAGPEAEQEELCNRLREYGVTHLNLFVLSHPDEDHIGGADGILKLCTVEEIWTNGAIPEENESYSRLLAAKSEFTVLKTVSMGEYFRLSGVTVTVLHPFADSEITEENESSLVIRLQFGEVGFLFPGDLEEDGERELASRFGRENLGVQVLHVGHHGSATSSSDAFLEAVAPDYIVISCREGNPYGHPNAQTLARLESTGGVVLRTDLMGEIVMKTDGKEIFVEGEE